MIHHSDDWLTVHVGDCREVMATLPERSVHTVVTSPPYWGLRDYGAEGQLGLEPTPEQYVENMVGVFREVRRVLRDDGTVWLNLGDSYSTSGGAGEQGLTGQMGGRRVADHRIPRHRPGLKPKDLVGIPWRVAFALQADGWYLRSDLIWSKPNPMPESVTDRPTRSHEYLFLLAKSPRYFFDADAVREPHTTADRVGTRASYRPGTASSMDGTEHLRKSDAGLPLNAAGRNIRSVWTIATQPYPGAHFATFPQALVEPCIRAGTSERGVCATCGAPWTRVVNVTRTTTGWQPSCAHEGDAVPAVVMDPFAGSGTVGVVAQRLSRRAVLIDLNPDYIDQQLRRNQQTPMGLSA